MFLILLTYLLKHKALIKNRQIFINGFFSFLEYQVQSLLMFNIKDCPYDLKTFNRSPILLTHVFSFDKSEHAWGMRGQNFHLTTIRTIQNILSKNNVSIPLNIRDLNYKLLFCSPFSLSSDISSIPILAIDTMTIMDGEANIPN